MKRSVQENIDKGMSAIENQIDSLYTQSTGPKPNVDAIRQLDTCLEILFKYQKIDDERSRQAAKLSEAELQAIVLEAK